jgi:hypothetical protein
MVPRRMPETPSYRSARVTQMAGSSAGNLVIYHQTSNLTIHLSNTSKYL